MPKGMQGQADPQDRIRDGPPLARAARLHRQGIDEYVWRTAFEPIKQRLQGRKRRIQGDLKPNCVALVITIGRRHPRRDQHRMLIRHQLRQIGLELGRGEPAGRRVQERERWRRMDYRLSSRIGSRSRVRLKALKPITVSREISQRFGTHLQRASDDERTNQEQRAEAADREYLLPAELDHRLLSVDLWMRLDPCLDMEHEARTVRTAGRRGKEVHILEVPRSLERSNQRRRIFSQADDAQCRALKV